MKISKMEIKRHNFRWNIPEIIRLEREYELLELSIQEIAKLHSRSVRAILCKLEKEGFIEHWEETKGYNEYINSDEDCESDEDSDYKTDDDAESESYANYDFDTSFLHKDISKEVSKDFEKLNNLQISLSYLSNMIKNLFDTNAGKHKER